MYNLTQRSYFNWQCEVNTNLPSSFFLQFGTWVSALEHRAISTLSQNSYVEFAFINNFTLE